MTIALSMAAIIAWPIPDSTVLCSIVPPVDESRQDGARIHQPGPLVHHSAGLGQMLQSRLAQMTARQPHHRFRWRTALLPQGQEVEPLGREREERVFRVAVLADPPALRAFGRLAAALEDSRGPGVFGEDGEFFRASPSGRSNLSTSSPTWPK